MLTANCFNCGEPKDPAYYGANYCVKCEALKNESEQHFAAENPNASESDILYAGRQALTQRAHTAHRNFTDPRAFSARSGMIPKPPEGGDRGTPQA